MLIRRVKLDLILVFQWPWFKKFGKRSAKSGGFDYSDLLDTPEGLEIDYFNGQFYIDYSMSAFENVIKWLPATADCDGNGK